jgi:FemAB-related protein (PEP-CTERM system-associated)
MPAGLSLATPGPVLASQTTAGRQIIRCDSSHDAEWNRFVHASPRASFYHRAEWRSVNERCFNHTTAYLAAVENSRFVGVLPLVRLKSRLFGNIACSMPFVNFGGPAAETDEIERQLLDSAARVADAWSVDYMEIRSRRAMGEGYHCSTHKVSMTIELDRDPDRLFNAFKSDHRKDIRRGYKYGFTARFGALDLLDDFYAILCESWRDLGTPIYSKDYLKTVLTTFPDSTRVCVVYTGDGVPAAAAFMGHHNGTVEGMWLGTRAAYRRQLVGYVLYWEIIKDACSGGHAVFHLGRSTADSGSEQFKKKWNAWPAQLYWHYVLRTRKDIPQLNVTNRKFQLAISAWRRLPVSVTQHIGPLLARSIP